ncbi:mobilization protein, partial [Acinetobacter nosocomialis]
RTASRESSNTEKTYHFEYGADFSSSYFAYSHFVAWSRHQKQIQRDADAKHGHQREANESRPPESVGRKPEYQHMHPTQEQIQTPMYPDQRESGTIRERLLHSNGVLNDDRIRNTVIENHRRTTAAITATTSAVAESTENFRQFFEPNSENIGSAGGNNQSRSRQLSENAKVIGDNAEAISRFREKYRNLYRADQWQSQRDEPNYNELRGRTGENLNRTAFSLVTSSQSATEFGRNIRNIEENLVQMKQRQQQKEMEKPQSKQDRGMSWGM